jgi:hypothetical protein
MQAIVALAIALGSAILSGVAATWYQLRRQRARPYAVALCYTRELFGDQAMVSIPGSVTEQLSLSVYLAGYGAAVAQLSLVREAAQACTEFQAQGQPLRDALAEVVAAIERGDDDARLKASLRSPLRMPLFDKFLMAAAKGRALADNDELAKQNERAKHLNKQWELEGKPPADVPMFESPAGDGSFQFGLPGGPVVVGRDVNMWPVAQYQQLPPFFQALRFLDPPLLRESFERLVNLLARDLQLAAKALPHLSDLLAEHYRCVSRLYLANYGAVPMMIQAGGTIQVRQADRPPLEISCQLATLADDDGIARTENGYLLSANAEIAIGFVSKVELQGESAELQDALRTADQKPCEVRTEFKCVSSAWTGAKTVRSRWAPSNFSTPGPRA